MPIFTSAFSLVITGFLGIEFFKILGSDSITNPFSFITVKVKIAGNSRRKDY